jgi:hypothetical protein
MTDTAKSGKLKVFVSYSRQDSSAFADDLVAGLELAGFEAFLDRHDIEEGRRKIRGVTYPCIALTRFL